MITRQEMLRKIIPATVRALESKRPLTLYQEKIVERMRAACHTMDASGKTTTEAIIKRVLYPQKNAPKRQGQTLAFNRLRTGINTLFLEAGKSFVMAVDRDKKKGGNRSVCFEWLPPQTSSGPIVALGGVDVGGAHALGAKEIVETLHIAFASRQIPIDKRARSIAQTFFMMAALVDKKGRTNHDILYSELYPNCEARHANKVFRLGHRRRSVNAFLETTQLPVRLMTDTTRQEWGARSIYFCGSLPDRSVVTLSNGTIVPKTPEEARQASRAFLKLYI